MLLVFGLGEHIRVARRHAASRARAANDLVIERVGLVVTVRREERMRQLTGLDAQFLALESPRQAGHVSGLAILDPGTRPNGRLELADLHKMIEHRLPLLPPFRWRLNLDAPRDGFGSVRP